MPHVKKQSMQTRHTKHTKHTKKQTRSQRRTRRLQREGLKYRYTNNVNRHTWVDTLYPFGSQVATIISNIPWESWHYQGPGKVAIGTPKNSIITETTVTTHLSSPAYHLFGGCVTEMYAKLYNLSDFPKLSDYTDPTADIDVRISPFIVTTEDTDLKGRQVFDTPHIRNFINWLINELKLGLRPVAKIMDLPPFRKMTRDENSETLNSKHSEHLGNILISETAFDGYTKIQVGVGIADGPASHFLEFVINHNNNLPINQVFTPKFVKTGNVFTLNYVDHIYEQLGALIDRHKQPKVPRNKVYNHYGRVYYTLKLMAHLVETGQLHPISQALLGDAEASLYNDIFYEEPYPCPKKCDIKGMRALMDIITGLDQQNQSNQPNVSSQSNQPQ